MFDSNRRAAAALRVPTWLLTAIAWVGFACLAIGGMAGIPALGVVAGLFGAAIAAIGLRGLTLPSEPVELGNPGMDSLFGTSRRVAAFYVLVGVVWIVLSATIVAEG
jgi:hypothetical protein